MTDLDADANAIEQLQVDSRGENTSVEHHMSFAPLRLASRSLLAQTIHKRRLPAMMQKVVTAATSAAPQIIPTPEPMKVSYIAWFSLRKSPAQHVHQASTA